MSPSSGMVADIDLSPLRRGATLWKLRSCNSWYRRRYWLDEQSFRLHYEPSRKPFWSNAKQYVDLTDMTDARLGWKTDIFNRAGRQSDRERAKDPNRPPLLKEECCFSIVHGRDGNKSLDLVASDIQTASTWVRCLKALVLFIRSLRQRKNDHKLTHVFSYVLFSLSYQLCYFHRWLEVQFHKADKNKSGALNFEECCQLLLQLNIKMEPREARKMFDVTQLNHTSTPK